MTLTMEFVLAGCAIFTAANPSGTHYTFRVRRAEFPGASTMYFADLLTGPDNLSDYTYLGRVVDDMQGRLTMVPTKKSRLGPQTTPVMVLNWALRAISLNRPIPPGYAILHAGRCGRCGRRLTVPASLYRGLGPECAARILQGAA